MLPSLGRLFPNTQHLVCFYLVVVNDNIPHSPSSTKQIYIRMWLFLLKRSKDSEMILWRSQESIITLLSWMTEGYKIAIPSLGLVHNLQTNGNLGWDLANQRDYQLKFSTLRQFHWRWQCQKRCFLLDFPQIEMQLRFSLYYNLWQKFLRLLLLTPNSIWTKSAQALCNLYVKCLLL